MPNEFGVNEFTAAELEQLFSDEFAQETPPASAETNAQTSNEQTETKTDVDQTKAFAKRLKESTDKARLDEREAIAKSLGYNSYDELQKSHEKTMLEDKGLDPEHASEVINELVKQRIESDPRIKELEQYRQQRVKEFGEKELAEITKLTDGEITSLAQLPKEVIDLWKQKGSLKSAYLEVEGEKRILKLQSEHSKGSTDHLKSVGGQSPAPTNVRPLTDAEKRVWKQFNPQMTDEELNKMTVKKD